MPAAPDRYVLAIDLGTSGPKVALISTRGEVVHHEFEPTPLSLLPGGGAEQNPDDWWTAITTAVQRLLAQELVPRDAIAAVSCTGQWSGTVAVDPAGRPLMNAIIWMDSRGAPYVRRVTGGWPEIERYDVGKLVTWIRLTGGSPTHSGKDSLAHILYLQHERPDIYRAAGKFLEPKDYINLRLTGRSAAGYDSITLYWLTDNRDIRHVDYAPKLLALTGIARDKLPDLVQAVDMLGPLRPEVAREWGLPEGVQVVTGAPDVHSAAIGSGAVQDCAAHLYIGTSSWLVCHVPFKKTDPAHNMASLPSAIPGRYLVINAQETAGACLALLRDHVIYPDDEFATGRPPQAGYALFDQVAARVPAGADKLIFTPWLYGERAPVEDAAVRGGFFNLTLRTTRAHMVRAVFEGVAYNSRWLLDYVEKFTGRRLDAVTMVGGGAASGVWCQIVADVFNRPVRQARDPILANARGAAFLAAAALGDLTFEEIPERVEIARVYTPDPANRGIYDELFGEFVNLYQSTRAIYARLNRAKPS